MSVTKLFLLTAMALLLATADVLGQAVDLNGNNMSDVWEGLFSATNLNANADADGDGVPNGRDRAPNNPNRS